MTTASLPDHMNPKRSWPGVQGTNSRTFMASSIVAASAATGNMLR